MIKTCQLEEAEEGLKCAKELQIEIINKGWEFYEKELLDYYPVELTEEIEKLAKKKKTIIAETKKKLHRDHVFHCLLRHIRKGIRDNINRFQVANHNKSTSTAIKRDEIEVKIKGHNATHFKNAHESIACKDKICNKLKTNNVRDRILNSMLQRDECDNERVHWFLTLLK